MYFIGLESYINAGEVKLPEKRPSDPVMRLCEVSLYPRIRFIIRAQGAKTVA